MQPIRKSIPVSSSEITPERLYLSRRDFLKAAGIVSATAFLAAPDTSSSPSNNKTSRPVLHQRSNN